MIDPPAKPKPQLAVQFFLTNGAVVHWPVPAGEAFSFPAMIQGIRSAGFFMAPDIYIAQDAISAIGLMGGTAKIQQPQHPTRQ